MRSSRDATLKRPTTAGLAIQKHDEPPQFPISPWGERRGRRYQAELFTQLDTIDGLRAWTEALVTLQRARNAKGGCPIGSLAGQLAEQDEGARLELADGLDRWETAIREGLERMAARGELHTGADPGALAQNALAAIQGGLLLTQVRRDPSQLRSALNGAINAILAARAVR